MIFRQALHTFISVNGSTVRIPDLTEDDLKFVAKDIINQIQDFDFFAEFPEHFADKIISEKEGEVDYNEFTKPQLAIEAREKYGIELSTDLKKDEMIAAIVEAAKNAVTE